MVQTANDLLRPSMAIIADGQTSSGSFLASPNFPTYRYSWFRDGAFVAQALDLWGEHDRSGRFYDWCARTIMRNRDVVTHVLKGPSNEIPGAHLHTRYRADGSPAKEDWPTFQLDGFGTFLWGMTEHVRLTGKPIDPAWREAANLVVSYLNHLWRSPNFDCWEEFPDRVHISTLCAIYGGSSAVADRLDDHRGRALAEDVGAFVRAQTTEDGHLPKFLGTQDVDASLLWACTPFGLLKPNDPVMSATATKIESDLLGPSGGVHRYNSDAYYGGGEWILLTALLGEHWLLRGQNARASDALLWIEECADETGALPEQVAVDLIAPEPVQTWVNRWGPVAQPLLWSHAAYLRLRSLAGQ